MPLVRSRADDSMPTAIGDTEMSELSDFPTFAEFLRAATGKDPFPWQVRLADHVKRFGRFPDAITVQTGLGKTTSMLVHLHALALDVHLNGAKHRTFPLRCFHIVERREVVDTSFVLAQKAAEAVNTAVEPDSTLYPVRDALSRLIPAEMADFEPIVSTVSLHGGIHTRGDWLRPVGAMLVTATVTQIASRALFRGVGVSQNTSPLHAAVTGMDRVILVDEPHLSEAAIAALKDAEAVQSAAAVDIGVPVGQTVILGATAPAHLLFGEPLTTDESDARHPVAGIRLRAAKTISLITVEGTRAPDVQKKLVDAMANAALDAHARDTRRGTDQPGGEHGVLVFVNTVKMAQRVNAALLKTGAHSGRLRLVHGRLRRSDRPELDLCPGDITVATQTLEVGADIDGFEVITQVSSLSSLIQRAGRCNRYGLLTESRVLVFAGRIVKAPGSSDDADSGPEGSDAGTGELEIAVSGESILDGGTLAVYGDQATALLAALTVLTDGGRTAIPAAPADIAALRDAAVAVAGTDVLDPPIRTATLRPQVARFAAYTDPGTDFPLEAFLSGPDTRRNIDVAIAWRNAETLDLLDDVGVHDDETVQVSLPALVDLLELASNAKLKPVAYLDDLDAGVVEVGGESKYRTDTRGVLQMVRLRSGRGWVTPSALRDITPGALVVLDTQLGGYIDTSGGAPGFDPQSRTKVTDVSEAVACRSGRGRYLLTDDGMVAELNEEFSADSSGRGAADRAEESLRAVGAIADTVAVTVIPLAAEDSAGDSDDGPMLRFVISLNDGSSDMGSNTCRAVLLADHCHQVGQWSMHSADVLPLRNVEAAAIVEAGKRHDHGKADRAFQASMGHRGDPLTAAWAKSTRDRSSAERRRLREQAGLSGDWRHEVASAEGIVDPLTRHLVVSHHMWGRPLIVHPDDEGGPDSRITRHVETFDALTDHYGPWGLALLETVMRWADHRASAYPKTYALDPLPVRAEPIRTPRCFVADEPAHELRLPGLTASPLPGTLAAIGLLDRIVRDGLDPDATIRWEPGTGIPVIGTSRDIRREVQEMTHDTEPWQHIARWLKKIGGDKAELTGSHAKVPMPEAFDLRGIPDAGDNAELLHQLLPDTQKLEPNTDPKKDPTFRLRCLLIHNNSTPFTAALIASPTEHFFNPAAGYVDLEECKPGGVDIHPHIYPGLRTRRDTLSWALAGYRALGWGAVHSGSAHVVLPTPTRWTTVAGYRALTAAGGLPAKGPSRTWARTAARLSQQQSVWAPADGSD